MLLKKHNFWIRTISGVVLLLLVLGLVMLSPYTMLILLVAICVGGMLEFYKIARLTGAEPLNVYPVILGVLVISIAFFGRLGHVSFLWFAGFLPALAIIFIAELYRNKKNPFANIAWAITGILYIAVPLALLAYLPLQAVAESDIAGAGGGMVSTGSDIVSSRGDIVSTVSGIVYRPLIVLGIIFIVWANDIGAYLFGVSLGRHKLFERISPKKSWEGFIGGVICAAGVGVLISKIMNAPLWVWGMAGLIIALSSVFGDLIESMLKRSAGVKDSGNLIPGHGGVLDRFDALIFAIPFVFTYFVVYL